MWRIFGIVLFLCFAGFSYFFHIWRSFDRLHVKTLIVKSGIWWMFLPSIEIVSNTDCLLFHNLSKVVGTNLPAPIPLSSWGSQMEILSLFYNNMKETFNESLSYINHFVVLHPFLLYNIFLLTFIRHLALIRSNLIEKVPHV